MVLQIRPRLSQLLLLHPDHVSLSWCSYPDCVSLSCCSLIASASAGAHRSHPSHLSLLLPDGVRSAGGSLIASASAGAPRSLPLQLLLGLVASASSAAPGLCPLAVSASPCNCPSFLAQSSQSSRFGSSGKVQKSCVTIVSPVPRSGPAHFRHSQTHVKILMQVNIINPRRACAQDYCSRFVCLFVSLSKKRICQLVPVYVELKALAVQAGCILHGFKTGIFPKNT